jgi:hypothetical protein
MSLLFLSLVLFYGIISLLATVTRDRTTAPTGRTTSEEQQQEVPAERMLRAAIVAVAMARAGAQSKATNSFSQASGERDITPWWSLHHQHRLAGKGKTRRRG